jgi:prepilin-type N-terminal cleavage/methylation domain-containing protein
MADGSNVYCNPETGSGIRAEGDRQPRAIYGPRNATAMRRRGFTLLELLMVVAILGVIAAIALPRIGSHSEEAKESALAQNVTIMTEAIERYRLAHNNTYPGTISATTNWANFVKHMTQTTDKNGNLGGEYGPYLRTGIPPNPLNGSKKGAVWTVAEPIDDTLGWLYNPETGEIKPYSGGGKPFIGDP